MKETKQNRKTRKLRYIRAKNTTRKYFKDCDPKSIMTSHYLDKPMTMDEMWKLGYAVRG